ncbi:MAG: hypothetical protein HFG72_02000 [Hungatella sp.]|nr:hypothetical protein [Hungatella sp.]
MKKSTNSFPGLEAPWETRKEMIVSGGSAPSEILIRIDQIRGNVRGDIKKSITKQRFDLMKKHDKNSLD